MLGPIEIQGFCPSKKKDEKSRLATRGDRSWTLEESVREEASLKLEILEARKAEGPEQI
jgi:hypothetical protein